MTGDRPKKKALVVDDSATARKLLEHYMKGFGFEVVAAKDGQEALDLLQDNFDLDVALIDWNMPVLDGLSFVEQARDRRLADCPMLMVTTECSISQVKKALEFGVQEFLMKPFERDMLADKLKILGFELPE